MIKEYANAFGCVTLETIEGEYIVKCKTKDNAYSSMEIYPYKYQAISQYQFSCGWLDRLAK